MARQTGTPDLLTRILDGSAPTFALLHRPEATGWETLEVLLTDAAPCASLAELPLPASTGTGAGHEVLALIPYRQIAERGFASHDDGEPLIAMSVRAQQTLPVSETLLRLPNEPVKLTDGHFDVADEEYADIVRRVITDEIGTGEGANFVIKRSFTAQLPGFSPSAALSFFRRLMERESGAYWTFLVHTGERTFVGATPERHISVHDGMAVMNPISGTYRYPSGGPTLDGVMSFLADNKEADELYMVVDEELKMMARICPSGGRVIGPYLKEMARLAHTEYFIEGHTRRDVRDILRETLFAPTVTGSPLENAAKVISRYEPAGRGYYSGVAALIGKDASGNRTLDSSILIRTADIAADGRLRIGVGATLVRHSDPDSEVHETRAKASGLLAALGEQEPTRFSAHPDVRAALSARNDGIAGFWLEEPGGQDRAVEELTGRKVLVIDAEDTFTAMIAHQLRALGPQVTVRRFDERYDFDAHDLVVMGPGPGDPRDARHPKIAHLRAAVSQLLEERRPFMAECLSHQVLSTLLGLDLVRRTVPNQGTQRTIDLFGRSERVGFYNTFAARSDTDTFEHPVIGAVEVSRDPATGEVHGLRGRGFASMQFHAESVLTQDGPRILGSLLNEVVSCTR
ncbi:anthranilate synthase family protein [Streptomyces sp. NBC_01142]|uniref:anthranilate synthase family protein n=1 Tax=Streptomyces sp. NBC_01142 TaxID=2975865 RepID=UPI00225420DE|nr:anthranilate synthase family protein [Streptomyces sp. NBC_01142]MCX4824943.1 anthranilate synthase family protein [Streptomyces sp. NBC_01142]